MQSCVTFLKEERQIYTYIECMLLFSEIMSNNFKKKKRKPITYTVYGFYITVVNFLNQKTVLE